jgi:hypothetical protein
MLPAQVVDEPVEGRQVEVFQGGAVPGHRSPPALVVPAAAGSA